jgi:hypothetical protein
MTVRIGADPEFFVRKGKNFISGHTFRCGTKELPLKTTHGFVQVDGLALEANVSPAETKDEFIKNVLGVIGDLNDIVRPKKCKIVAKPTVDFGTHYLKSLPPHIRQLGCNPDYNAYTGGMNEIPNGQLPFRTGAGHIHVGWTEGKDSEDMEHLQNCILLVKTMDYFVGLRTLKFDTDAKRRQLYGNAGAFRVKPYGVEYRVPSSAWCTSEALMGEVFDATKAAVDYAQSGKDINDKYDNFAQIAIDKNITDWDELNPDVAAEIGYSVTEVNNAAAS